MLLTVALSGCATCNEAEFLARVDHEERVMSNWAPGEFDMVDEERALLKGLRVSARASGDYSAACRTIDEFKDAHTIRGHH